MPSLAKAFLPLQATENIDCCSHALKCVTLHTCSVQRLVVVSPGLLQLDLTHQVRSSPARRTTRPSCSSGTEPTTAPHGTRSWGTAACSIAPEIRSGLPPGCRRCAPSSTSHCASARLVTSGQSVGPEPEPTWAPLCIRERRRGLANSRMRRANKDGKPHCFRRRLWANQRHIRR